MNSMMIFFSLLFAITIQAQDLTAFRQDIRNGVSSIGTDAQGQMFITNQDETAYYIYLASEAMPTIQELWIDGRSYGFTVAEITGPVVIKTGFRFKQGQESHLLATPGDRPVYRIVVGPSLQQSKRRGIGNGVYLVLQDRSVMHVDLRQLPDAWNQ